MSMILNSTMHGMIAGGTACYLQNQLENETARQSSNAWTTASCNLTIYCY
jgi:hypothetical protein